MAATPSRGLEAGHWPFYGGGPARLAVGVAPWALGLGRATLRPTRACAEGPDYKRSASEGQESREPFGPVPRQPGLALSDVTVTAHPWAVASSRA